MVTMVYYHTSKLTQPHANRALHWGLWVRSTLFSLRPHRRTMKRCGLGACCFYRHLVLYHVSSDHILYIPRLSHLLFDTRDNTPTFINVGLSARAMTEASSRRLRHTLAHQHTTSSPSQRHHYHHYAWLASRWSASQFPHIAIHGGWCDDGQ